MVACILKLMVFTEVCRVAAAAMYINYRSLVLTELQLLRDRHTVNELASAIYYEKAEWLIAFAFYLILTLPLNVFRKVYPEMCKLNDSMCRYVVSMVFVIMSNNGCGLGVVKFCNPCFE